MDSEYYEKYIKYKSKYTNLLKIKNQRKIGHIGGGVNSEQTGKVKVAVCTLNQWSIDFIGNEERIKKAIEQAKKEGAKLIVFPELATSGYSCQDHFIEREIIELSFNIIKHLLSEDLSSDVLISIGCPIIHNDVRYNTTIFISNNEIILIRPKINLADDGNYREARWFTSWPKEKYETFTYMLGNNKKTCPIGIGIINANNVLVSVEMCEELWTPDNINSELYLNGVDILINPSGSHFEAGKLQKRIDLINGATRRCGGAYLYCNLEGCDGERLYFDGASMVGMNGTILDIEDRFTMRDIQVLTVDIEISLILSYRLKNNSFENQASKQKKFNTIDLNLNLITTGTVPYSLVGETLYKKDISEFKSIPEIENMVNAASCWLWDYLRRSNAMGFMLPLSGGADSASTATIVFNMCCLMLDAYKKEKEPGFYANKNVTAFINNFFTLREDNSIEEISEPQQLCSRILNTVYLPTAISGKVDLTSGTSGQSASSNSGDIQSDSIDLSVITSRASKMKTGFLASQLAKKIGARHDVVDIQGMFEAGINGISGISGKDFLTMKEEVKNGRVPGSSKSTWDLLYQNIQARLRMINAYLLAQALPSIPSKKYTKNSFILVLGSSNSDEILVGYYTKYDASAADINPIGSLSKYYVNQILEHYGSVKKIYPLLYIRTATPTAELIETVQGVRQSDEIDMGITYAQIYELGKLRSMGLGPIDSYLQIKNNPELKKIFSQDPDGNQVTPDVIVKRFYYRYTVNRNKTTIIPPSVHLTPNPDDNRYDLRPFLYPLFGTIDWKNKMIGQGSPINEQLKIIDEIAKKK
jgi:NAD+ synthase (glutamine-hydrolysing)